MDAFESVVSAILRGRGYWTTLNWKVALTKDEKRAIGRHSSPRWELDVVGYRGSTNELLVMECKSFLDSPGVRSETFAGNQPEDEKRYKLFFDDALRTTVLDALVRQLVQDRFCAATPTCRLGLAAGKVYGDEAWLKGHCASKGWEFLGPSDIREELRKLRDVGYENDVATVVAKILLRDPAA